MSRDLLGKKCVPCEGGVAPMTALQAADFLKEIPGWEISDDGKKIARKFVFKKFKEAISFVNAVAELAETEGHHPDFHIRYSSVTLELWTHAIGGLFENDFIVAAKINAL